MLISIHLQNLSRTWVGLEKTAVQRWSLHLGCTELDFSADYLQSPESRSNTQVWKWLWKTDAHYKSCTSQCCTCSAFSRNALCRPGFIPSFAQAHLPQSKNRKHVTLTVLHSLYADIVENPSSWSLAHFVLHKPKCVFCRIWVVDEHKVEHSYKAKEKLRVLKICFPHRNAERIVQICEQCSWVNTYNHLPVWWGIYLWFLNDFEIIKAR